MILLLTKISIILSFRYLAIDTLTTITMWDTILWRPRTTDMKCGDRLPFSSFLHLRCHLLGQLTSHIIHLWMWDSPMKPHTKRFKSQNFMRLTFSWVIHTFATQETSMTFLTSSPTSVDSTLLSSTPSQLLVSLPIIVSCSPSSSETSTLSEAELKMRVKRTIFNQSSSHTVTSFLTSRNTVATSAKENQVRSWKGVSSFIRKVTI